METSTALLDSLREPAPAIAYSLSRRLAALTPERFVLEGGSCAFDLEGYAEAGGCSCTVDPGVHGQFATAWVDWHAPLKHSAESVWLRVEWQGQRLEAIRLQWPAEAYSVAVRWWIVADTRAIAEAFFEEVSRWSAALRGEVLVFDEGAWHKSRELYDAIQGSSLDNLILRDRLKQEIHEDLSRFFASRETYELYDIPWKRGILFVGPPGNGKTHTVKALINALGQSCLYVKSFQGNRWQTPHSGIRAVFEHARRCVPCILVLEDLDSLVDEHNRSFFLNELDGFASNTGIVTLATTNHPERLDPAILDRPSRFDRKYHFPLPGYDERLAYFHLWNGTLQPPLRMDEGTLQELAEATDSFSFAYLKEMYLSAMMRWISASQPGAMRDVILGLADLLRSQMESMNDERPDTYGYAVGDEDDA